MSTKSVDFRPLPTPEQVRAHGEGGLWETEDRYERRAHYKLWDRDRATPWYDCSSSDGNQFCLDGQPWPNSAKRTPDPAKFRPLNPDGTPRDWAEIDAIVTQSAPSAVPATAEPDYRAPTDDELRAHVANGGMWQDDDWFYEVWTDEDNRLVGWCHCALPSARGGGWDINSHSGVFADRRKHLRPVDRQGKPTPWSKVARSAAEAPDPAVTPPPDGKFQVGDVVRVLRFSGDERFVGGNPQWNREMELCLDAPTTMVGLFGTWLSVKDPKNQRSWYWPVERVSFVSRPSKAEPEQKPAAMAAPATAAPAPEFRKLTREIATANPVSSTSRLVSHTDSLGTAVLQIEDAVRRAIAERVSLSPPAALPKDGDPITVAGAVAIAREGARQAMQEVGQASPRSIDTLVASDLDFIAESLYSLSRQPNETDEQLRQRCRNSWKTKENPMPTIPGVTMATMSTPAIPNFAAMSPEDRARYRAALDAADPPTFRDALRSGLEHAPVELALDKLHTFVSRLADLWTEGNEEERATVRRFLRDLLSSDYGKAAIGLGAGAAIPHAAPLAAKLLPEDKDAGPLLRRVGFILVERGTATGAKRLGLDIWDAAGPMLDELRQMLRDLVKGMKQADTVVGFLPPASPKPDFTAGVVEAETVPQKR